MENCHNETDFIIEENIPIPARGRKNEFPFKIMNVGDSFLVKCPLDKVARRRIQGRMGTAARTAGAPIKWEFATRQVKEGIRCWRKK